MTIETGTGASAPDVVAILNTAAPANERRSAIDGVVKKTTIERTDMPAKADGVVNTAAHAPVANTDAVANPAATVAVRNHTAAENRIVVGNSAAAKLTAADLVATRAAVTWAAAR